MRRRTVWLSILLRTLAGLLILTTPAMVTGACGSVAPESGFPAPTSGSTMAASPSTVSTAAVTSAASAMSTIPAAAPISTTGTMEPVTLPPEPGAPVTITVLYDNTALRSGTRADWGFSCLVTGLKRTILFDAGKDGDILLFNMEALGVGPEDVDVVVLSHEHSDHTGGLDRIVVQNDRITVYYPASSSAASISRAQAAGAALVPVDAPTSIGEGVLVTSPLGAPAESALVVHTPEGPVLITGCAHPGIVEMVRAASDLVSARVFAVLGGFHLVSCSGDQVGRIIEGLKELGVERCGPAHCTGEAATAQIKAAFGEGFIEMGVGTVIVF